MTIVTKWSKDDPAPFFVCLSTSTNLGLKSGACKSRNA